MKKPYNPQMTVVKSPEDAPKADPQNRPGGAPRSKETPLSHEELLALVRSKGTVMEREQAVIENLRRQGLIE